MPRSPDHVPGLAVAARCGVTVLRRVDKSRVAVRCPYRWYERWVVKEALFAWAKTGVPTCEKVARLGRGAHCRVPDGEPTEGSCHG